MPESKTMAASPEQRLQELKLTLPPVGKPVAAYVPWVKTGTLVFIAGQVPMKDGKPAWVGKVGKELTLAQGQEAARQATLQALAVLKEAAGGLERVVRIVRTTNFVNAAPGFTDIHLCANGASELLGQVLGDAGKHSRVSIGVAELPFGVPYEIDLVAEVK